MDQRDIDFIEQRADTDPELKSLWEDHVLLKKQVEERFGIQAFLIDYVGPTIGAHSGPGTLALFFMGEKR